MKRLRAAQHGSQGLDCNTDNIIIRLLCRQGGPCRLRVKPQHPGTRILSVKTISHHSGPDSPGSAKLRYLLEKIIMRVEKERKAGSEGIDIQATIEGRLHIRHCIREGECELLNCRRTGFTNMVSAYRNGIPVRYL